MTFNLLCLESLADHSSATQIKHVVNMDKRLVDGIVLHNHQVQREVTCKSNSAHILVSENFLCYSRTDEMLVKDKRLTPEWFKNSDVIQTITLSAQDWQSDLEEIKYLYSDIRLMEIVSAYGCP